MQAKISPTLAMIAVDIIGDKVVEPNETFYLDLSNLMGGSLGADVRMLTGCEPSAMIGGRLTSDHADHRSG
jgi:hypothetical protein